MVISLKVLAAPAVRRIAREENVNLSQVTGSGKEGRILKEDVLAFIAGLKAVNHIVTNYLHIDITGGRKPSSSTSTSTTQQQTVVEQDVATATTSSAPSEPSRPAYQLEDRDVPVKGIKKVMVKSMTAANQVPHFGYCDEILMNSVKSIREQLKPYAQAQNVKLSYLPFIIKACSLALKQYPDLNAFTNRYEKKQ